MNACPSCRRAFPDGAETCLYCGRTVGGRCGKCGAWVRSDRQACPSCGEPWTLGMLQAARESRKRQERALGIGEEAAAKKNGPVLTPGIDLFDPSDPRRDEIYLALVKRALKERHQRWLFFLFQEALLKVACSFGAVAGGVASYWVCYPRILSTEAILGCVAGGFVLGAMLIIMPRKLISRRLGVTPQAVRCELDKQLEDQKAARSGRR